MIYHNIRLYPFDTEENDDEEIQLNESIRVRKLYCRTNTNFNRMTQNMIPFAVVGSERSVIIDGKSVRGRKTRWGVVNVEDEKHCEFVYLRNFLTRYVRKSWSLYAFPKYLHILQNTPTRPYRDHRSNSLRGVPLKTTSCTQGAD